MPVPPARQLYELGLDLLRQGRKELALARFLDAAGADQTDAAPYLRAIDLLIELDRPRDAIRLSDDLFSGCRDDSMEVILSCPLPAIPACDDDVDLAFDYFERRLASLTGRTGLRLDAPHLALPKGHFLLPYHDRPVRGPRQAMARLMLKAHPELAFTAPHAAQGGKTPGPRLRLGVVSSLLANHTIGLITVPLLEALIDEGVDLHLFLLGASEDAALARLKARAAAVATLPQRLQEAQALIAAQKLDALLYPEIGMDPFVYCLAFARLAPLQMMMWGHPMTSGLASIDYFITSDLIEPENGEAHYAEKLLRLPVMPIVSADHHLAAPPARADLGLPLDKRLYVCPQSLFKLSPKFDQALADILATDPDGVLVLLEGQKPEWKDRLLARLRPRLGGAENRVLFLPRMDRLRFIGLLAAADVLLDPFGFSGGNTSAEALANGTPIVTLPGNTMAGRVTLGFLRQLGVDETVAQDEAHYVRLALAAAKAKARHRELLTRSKKRLFGRAEAASHIYAFLTKGFIG